MTLDLKTLVKSAKERAAKPKDRRLSKRAVEEARQKKLGLGKFEDKRAKTLADFMRAIEEARRWEPQAIVLLVQRQTCTGCNNCSTNTVGLFVRQKHNVSGAMKLSPTNSADAIGLYRRELKEIEMQTPACPVCFKAQDLIDVVFNGVNCPNGQLPLFNALL